jgi:hypothetical protein
MKDGREEGKKSEEGEYRCPGAHPTGVSGLQTPQTLKTEI